MNTAIHLRSLTPWAPNRASLYRHMAEAAGPGAVALPDDANWRLRFLDRGLQAYSQDLTVFAVVVPPVIDAIDCDADIGAPVVDLIRRIADAPALELVVQLYQLLVCAVNVGRDTWLALDDALRAPGGLGAQPMVRELFLWWAQESPDEQIVDTSLFVLARCTQATPLGLLTALGRCPHFAYGVACALALQHGPAEDALISLARLHGGRIRTNILEQLRVVANPRNKAWLLTEGYENGVDWEDPCAYFAVVHGGLIDVLRKPGISRGELFHAVSAMARLCMNVGDKPFFRYWWTMVDYRDGPEALRLLLAHVAAAGGPEELWAGLRVVLYAFLDREQFDPAADGVPVWNTSIAAPPEATLRALLSLPHVPRWVLHGHPPATVANLEAYGPSQLNEVVSGVDGVTIDALVQWAVCFLALDQDEHASAQRRAELLDIPLDGVCTGGLAGVTDPALGSQYGQVLLQMLQCLRNVPSAAAWPLLEAGLGSDVLFHRQAAAEALSHWPGPLPAGAVEAVHRALHAAPDDEALRHSLASFLS